jgi:hypothetical protein
MDGCYPHNAYALYDLELSREAEARDHGFDNWEDYQMSKSDEMYERLVNEERLFNPYAR